RAEAETLRANAEVGRRLYGGFLPMRVNRLVGASASAVANVAWHTFQSVNKLFAEGSFQAKWAPARLLKTRERSFPQLGFPRKTDSLCPRCVKEVRDLIIQGEIDWHILVDGKPGEIQATIVERDGKVFMEKTCEK